MQYLLTNWPEVVNICHSFKFNVKQWLMVTILNIGRLMVHIIGRLFARKMISSSYSYNITPQISFDRDTGLHCGLPNVRRRICLYSIRNSYLYHLMFFYCFLDDFFLFALSASGEILWLIMSYFQNWVILIIIWNNEYFTIPFEATVKMYLRISFHVSLNIKSSFQLI